MSGEWKQVQVADGQMDVFVALSDKPDAPSLVVVQEIFGVNRHIQDVAQRYAAMGFNVYAPDIFWRETRKVSLSYEGEDYQRAISLLQATEPEKVVADIVALRAHIQATLPGNGKCGIVGYCFGGLLSFMAAATGSFDAAASYYGGGILNRMELASSIKNPMIFHFGEVDDHVPLETAVKLEEAFAGRDDVSVHVHPGADHGFNCDLRASFHPQASAMAGEMTHSFFKNYLG
ncbi:dienelactone hydrolase family protein [Pokkaliibacter sp. CJK22405]|uniref:dienelactone hydrolase family protein n=1 Tax=Pokkaliibacter sp. CJK22405 TaxID=3384615 RepID=UPI00398564EA